MNGSVILNMAQFLFVMGLTVLWGLHFQNSSLVFTLFHALISLKPESLDQTVQV